MTKSKDENDIFASLCRAAPELPEEKLRAIAAKLQHDIAGAYVKKAPAEGKAWRLGTALAAGASVAQAFADAGVSRAQGYRLMRRKWVI